MYFFIELRSFSLWHWLKSKRFISFMSFHQCTSYAASFLSIYIHNIRFFKYFLASQSTFLSYYPFKFFVSFLKMVLFFQYFQVLFWSFRDLWLLPIFLKFSSRYLISLQYLFFSSEVRSFLQLLAIWSEEISIFLSAHQQVV